MKNFNKVWLMVSVLAMLALIMAACAPAASTPDADTGDSGDAADFAGETVTIFTAAEGEQVALFQRNFDAFEERTGIEVVVEASPDFETVALVRAEAGDSYDILNFPQPGLMADFARSGFLVDLGGFLSQDYMLTKYTQSWIDLGTVDGSLYGVWHNADVKSLVWYAKPAFDAAGYSIPQTWDEMIALSDQIVADGGTPWCIGFESGGATGWPGTDWVEDIMLRTASPEDYDAWVAGELAFDSPQVRNAFEVASEIWMNPDYVLGGTTGILTTNFGDAPNMLLGDEPACYMMRQASFIAGFFAEGTEIGTDVDYFYLPPIDAAYGKPVLGSGSLLSMGKDTPAVRAVMEFLTTGESARAEVEAGILIAPHLDASLDWYPNDLTRGFAEILANADTFRFDGSDLMPGAVGAGSFWTGIVDFVGGSNLDSVLQAIDTSWP
ncbi:MAG: carbohydrate ABC transporter substrate-binding protein [Anaerolineales bacterium]|nr:carbohydrate ABC transporter substrate-binding protein [Anaerolineales bacterium]MCW5856278.1 carbohydrate ABC transporter substrate-binding protein [Anaerolineales bacterium]